MHVFKEQCEFCLIIQKILHWISLKIKVVIKTVLCIMAPIEIRTPELVYGLQAYHPRGLFYAN